MIDISVGSVLDNAFGDASSRLLVYAEEYQSDPTALERERDNFSQAIAWSFGSQRWGDVMRFTDAIGSPARGFLGMRGYWEDVVDYCSQAMEAAVAMNDREKLARYTANLGTAYQRLGRSGQARVAYETALQLLTELQDENAMATVLHQLGNQARSRGALDEAQSFYERSIEISRIAGRTSQVAATLYQLGTIAYDRKDENTAGQYYEESLELARRIGDQRLECRILNGLADIATVRSDFDAGRTYLAESLRLANDIGDALQVAHALMDLALLEEWAHDYRNSLEVSEEALALLTKLQSPLVDRVRRLRQRVIERLTEG